MKVVIIPWKRQPATHSSYMVNMLLVTLLPFYYIIVWYANVNSYNSLQCLQLMACKHQAWTVKFSLGQAKL